ncbi:hypothetical protein Aduo_011451 [Ancylostoma duodenale]
MTVLKGEQFAMGVISRHILLKKEERMHNEPRTPPRGTAAPPPRAAGAAAGAAAGVAAGVAAGFLPKAVILEMLVDVSEAFQRTVIRWNKKKILGLTRGSRASLRSKDASDENNHERTGEHFRSGRRG